MVCIYCSGKTSVFNSRHQKRNNQIWRRRRCEKCNQVFTTLEIPDYTAAWRIIKKNGQYMPFINDLLYTEVLFALSSRKNAYIEARELTGTIIKQVSALPTVPVISSSDISKTVAAVLKRFDKQAWHRYAADHPSVI